MAQLANSADLASARDALDARGAGYFTRDDGHLFLHTGPDALDLLHRITTNSLLDLEPGTAKRTVLTSEIGRVIDVVWVVMLKSDELLVISDSADYVETQRGILKYTIIEEACLHDLTNSHGRVTLLGDEAAGILGEAGFHINDGPDADVIGTVMMLGDGVTALKSDVLGVATWEIVGAQERISAVVSELTTRDVPRLPTELLHSIRMANRVPWPSVELNDRVNPLEAGLWDLVDFDKGCYVGQEVIARLDSYDKVQRKLVAVEPRVSGEVMPEIRDGIDLFAEGGGRSVGWITSVGSSIDGASSTGLAFVRNNYADAGTDLYDENGTNFRIVD